MIHTSLWIPPNFGYLRLYACQTSHYTLYCFSWLVPLGLFRSQSPRIARRIQCRCSLAPCIDSMYDKNSLFLAVGVNFAYKAIECRCSLHHVQIKSKMLFCLVWVCLINAFGAKIILADNERMLLYRENKSKEANTRGACVRARASECVSYRTGCMRISSCW